MKTNQLEKILALGDRYSDDLTQEIILGKVLALYKLEQVEKAEKFLHKRLGRCRHSVKELLKSEHPQPEMLSEGRVRMGGEDEAWLYWQEQGNLWQATPGAMEWLRDKFER